MNTMKALFLYFKFSLDEDALITTDEVKLEVIGS
jgi:hypothetical protein